MASYFITGASRGIGLALSGALAAKPASEVSVVFAAYRTNTEELQKLVSSSQGRVQAVQLDVASDESAKKAASQVEESLSGKGLDVLINNAGVSTFAPDGIQTMTDLNEVFNINVTGVHNVTRHCIPLLEKGSLKKIINVSTSIGSVTLVNYGVHVATPSYKITKAALNMLTAQYALQYGDEGFAVTAISPGWIKTNLGTDYADLTMDQALPAIVDLVLRINKEHNGKFLDVKVPGWEHKYSGSEIPW